MTRHIGLAVIISVALAMTGPALAQSAPTRTEAIQFAPGTSSKTIKGTIKGSDFVDYVVTARAGQHISVSLASSLTSNYFNLMPKGDETALHNGSINGNSYKGALPASGDYVIRVYIMRNDARRNKTASYSLTAAISP